MLFCLFDYLFLFACLFVCLFLLFLFIFCLLFSLFPCFCLLAFVCFFFACLCLFVWLFAASYTTQWFYWCNLYCINASICLASIQEKGSKVRLAREDRFWLITCPSSNNTAILQRASGKSKEMFHSFTCIHSRCTCTLRK